MNTAKKQTAVVSDSFVRSGGSPPAVPSLSATPLLVDIRVAAQILGTSIFNVRTLCWSPQHRALLSPVRLGAKYLFSPEKLAAFVAALVVGKIQFPASSSKTPKQRKRVSR